MKYGLLVFPRLDDSVYGREQRLLLTQRLEPSVLYVAPEKGESYFINDNQPRPDVDLYLCSVYTRGWEEFTHFSARVGRERIVAGGYHPTAEPHLTHRYAARVITGYCGNIDEQLDKPVGIYQGAFSFTRMRRDLIPQQHYCQIYPDVQPGETVGSMVTSVGCPYDCSFCSTPSMANRRMKVTEQEYVEQEIADLQSRGVSVVFIRDESFATNPRLKEVATSFKRKFRMVYSFGTGNVMGANPELVRHLADCGWHSLNFGLEDVNQVYRKNKRLADATENCRRYGMQAVLSFIVNDDRKSRDEARANYQALYEAFCDLKPAQVCANFLMPFPGTGLWPAYRDRITAADYAKYDSKTPLFSRGEDAVWHKRMIVAIQLKYYYSRLYNEQVRTFECGDTLHLRIVELMNEYGFQPGAWDTFLGF
jgi:radical SAM superfamily enzyme YgiQ (UPF0313 family)